jgi:hypothetical protein
LAVFLEKFRSSIPAVQGKQILNLLQQKKDRGEIKTIEEFKTQLSSLTAQLLSEEIVPSLKVFFGEAGEVIDIESYNFMLERISDDLEVAFTEVNTISDVLEAHKQIVNQVVLKTIQFGINELRERVNLYEFINGNKLGLDQGQFNTFSTTKSISTPRGTSLSSILYQGTTVAEDAIVDPVGERLILARDQDINVAIHSIRQIFDDETSASELDVEFKDSAIENLIDGLSGTYWLYSTQVSSPFPDGVLQKVEINLAATQDINSVDIEPASLHPMTLEKITYIGNDTIERDTNIPSFTLAAPVKVNFARVTANKVILHLRQNNYVETQFEEKDFDTNFYDVVVGDPSDPNIESISEHFREILSSNFLLEDILGIPRNRQLAAQRKFYQYLFGFDNIRVGFSNYRNRSIFVSKVLETTNPGQVALTASESIAGEVGGVISTDVDSFDESKFYHGSIEYEVVKENFDAGGNFIGVDRFSILPIGQTRVIHERVFMTEKVDGSTRDNAGFLRFFPDLDGSTGDIRGYRNGTEMVEGTGFVINRTPGVPSPGLDLLDQESPNVENRMRKAVKVLNPVISDIYTFTYTPKTGNSLELPKTTTSLLNVVNLGDAGRIRICRENLIVTDRLRGANIIAKSNTYLVILLRRNSAELHLTPTVEEYALYVGSEDLEKFVSEF